MRVENQFKKLESEKTRLISQRHIFLEGTTMDWDGFGGTKRKIRLKTRNCLLG